MEHHCASHSALISCLRHGVSGGEARLYPFLARFSCRNPHWRRDWPLIRKIFLLNFRQLRKQPRHAIAKAGGKGQPPFDVATSQCAQDLPILIWNILPATTVFRIICVCPVCTYLKVLAVQPSAVVQSGRPPAEIATHRRRGAPVAVPSPPNGI